MCCGCYEEYGSPKIDNPKVREAVEAMREVYEHSCVGGNLHVYIDDWNLYDNEDGGFLRSMLASIEENIHEAEPDQLEAERRCARLLAGLTEDEAASALGLHDGCWGRGNEADDDTENQGRDATAKAFEGTIEFVYDVRNDPHFVRLPEMSVERELPSGIWLVEWQKKIGLQ